MLDLCWNENEIFNLLFALSMYMLSYRKLSFTSWEFFGVIKWHEKSSIFEMNVLSACRMYRVRYWWWFSRKAEETYII